MSGRRPRLTALPIDTARPLRALVRAARARLGPPLASLARDLLEFALPQRCPGCGAPASAATLLCAGCLARIPRLVTPLCARCLVEGGDPSACRRHATRRVHAAWVFDERAQALVHALKYGARPELARALGPAIAASLPPGARRPELVTEVPLHAARARERGYNQSERLAASLADALGAPHVSGLLARTRPTAPQARLRQRDRRANVEGAFVVSRPGWVRGRRILVVDDVMTTGATLDACLEALARAGARPAGAALAWAQ